MKPDPAVEAHNCILETELGNHGTWTGCSIEGSRAGILRLAGAKAGQQMTEAILEAYSQWLHHSSTLRWKGRVTHVVGNLVESVGPFCSVGESCEMEDSNGNLFSRRSSRVSWLDGSFHAAGQAAGYSFRRPHCDLGRTPFPASRAGFIRTRDRRPG